MENNFIRHCDNHIHEICQQEWWIPGIIEICPTEMDWYKEAQKMERK